MESAITYGILIAAMFAELVTFATKFVMAFGK